MTVTEFKLKIEISRRWRGNIETRGVTPFEGTFTILQFVLRG